MDFFLRQSMSSKPQILSAIRITHLHEKNSCAKKNSNQFSKSKALLANEGMHPGFESQPRADVTLQNNETGASLFFFKKAHFIDYPRQDINVTSIN